MRRHVPCRFSSFPRNRPEKLENFTAGSQDGSHPRRGIIESSIYFFFSHWRYGPDPADVGKCRGGRRSQIIQGSQTGPFMQFSFFAKAAGEKRASLRNERQKNKNKTKTQSSSPKFSDTLSPDWFCPKSCDIRPHGKLLCTLRHLLGKS